MKIGFLGAGNMTTQLGKRFVARGHEVSVSYSRDPSKLAQTAASIGAGARTASPREVAQSSDVVILATGWDGASGALAAAGSLEQKTLWSILNPFKPDFSGLRVGTTTSGAEEVARQARGAALVACIPPFADLLATGSTRFGSERPTTYYCGDDEPAKQRVARLLEALDVDAVDAGPLFAARFIEPSMFLLMHLAYGRKLGQVAGRLLQR